MYDRKFPVRKALLRIEKFLCVELGYRLHCPLTTHGPSSDAAAWPQSRTAVLIIIEGMRLPLRDACCADFPWPPNASVASHAAYALQEYAVGGMGSLVGLLKLMWHVTNKAIDASDIARGGAEYVREAEAA